MDMVTGMVTDMVTDTGMGMGQVMDMGIQQKARVKNQL